ncbi:MAG: hypothetical protein CMJ47_11905 [Planctomyces sp.]|nr:hypothetical protein [Planctomyces sp.]
MPNCHVFAVPMKFAPGRNPSENEASYPEVTTPFYPGRDSRSLSRELVAEQLFSQRIPSHHRRATGK